VLFHGYAQNERYFDDALAGSLTEGHTYISVRAPLALRRGSYFWFPLITSPQFSIERVIGVCHEIIPWLESQRERYTTIILAGFSQGTEVTSTIYRLRPDLVDELIFLSGIIVDEEHADFQDAALTSQEGPGFFGTDLHDGVLPRSLLDFSKRWPDQHTHPSAHATQGWAIRSAATRSPTSPVSSVRYTALIGSDAVGDRHRAVNQPRWPARSLI